MSCREAIKSVTIRILVTAELAHYMASKWRIFVIELHSICVSKGEIACVSQREEVLSTHKLKTFFFLLAQPAVG